MSLRRSNLHRVVLCCAVGLLAGCRAPTYDLCAVRCGPGGACPAGWACAGDAYCHPAGDTTSCGSASCGDGHVDEGETCDDGCPTSCDDGNACTTDTMAGSAAGCDVVCSHAPITACQDGDGCCPAGCDHTVDLDCSPTCGDHVVDEGETCDGDCPASCDDDNACTLDALTGSAANCNVACSHTSVTQCRSGDGCCPAGCSHATDGDCSATCPNGTVETGETCDGDCPASCDDGNACTLDAMTGSAANCNVVCGHTTITQCQSGDGCCPAGCNHNVDLDCAPTCANGVVEDGESCDGNCPTSCDDGNVCTKDTLSGSAATCDVACGHATITQCQGGDGCCPSGCTHASDGDCPPTCTDQCTLDARECSGTVAYRVCKTTASGCTDWDAPVGCADGQHCAAGACAAGCPAEMVSVTARGTCIDRYEASPGAGGQAASVAGALPWVSVTQTQAVAACAAAGKRLCGEAEWQAACSGASGYTYPYGNTYVGTACNGLDAGLGAIVATMTLASCQGGYAGVFDMSGNAYELTATCTGTNCRVKGGSYRSSATAGLLKCTTGFDFNSSNPDPAVGFRCCH